MTVSILQSFHNKIFGSAGSCEKTITVTGAYTFDSTSTGGNYFADTVVLCNLSAAATITLPPSALATGTAGVGRRVRVKDISGSAATHNITIAPASGTIDGASTYVLNVNKASVELVCDGTNWWVVSSEGYGVTALTQDVTASGSGSVAATVTQAQAGLLQFASGTGNINASSAATAPGLSQSSTTAATPATMTITPQQSTNTNGNGSNLVINLGSYSGSGASGYVTVASAGTPQVAMGAYPYPGNAFQGIWFGNGAVSPSQANYSFLSNTAGTLTYLNVPSASGTVTIRAASGGIMANFDANQQILGLGTGYGLQVGSTTANMGGGAGVLGITNATTLPTSYPSGGIVFASNSGILNIYDGNSITTTLGGGYLTANGIMQIYPTSVSASAGFALTLSGGATTGTSLAGGQLSLVSGKGTSANGALALSTGNGTSYGSTGVVSSGNTPGSLSLKGPSLTTTQLATTGKGTLSTSNVYSFLPITINGVTAQLIVTF